MIAVSKRYDNLFTFIMEADEIPEFDFGDAGGDAVPDTAGDAANASPETSDPASGGDPPELSQDNTDEFNFNPEGEDTTDMGDMSENPDDQQQQDQEDNKEGEDIGHKTNDIFNERLYRKLTDRNTEIENTLDQIQRVVPVLPYEIVQELDKPLNQLKTALSKGQSYAIDKFINAEYGENLLFFEKLNSAYILIEDKIDKIIKKAKQK